MQLPFTVIFEPPSGAELVNALRSRRIRLGVVVAGVAISTLTFVQMLHREEVPNANSTLQIVGTPVGAAIEIDGRGLGRMPASLSVAPGEHRVTLRHEGYADATHLVSMRAGESAVLSAELWMRRPKAQRLRPAFPGAGILDARFLRDGRIALTVGMPPGDERQLWLLDGRGGIRRFGLPNTHGAIAIAPDGKRAAYFARRDGSHSGSKRLEEVWVSEREGERGERRYSLPDDTADERLLDLGWSPGGDQLLISSVRQLLGGGQRTVLHLLDVIRGEARELVSLPSEVVPGSLSWDPSGDRVAFVTLAGQLSSLCLVGTGNGEFRYLADLGEGDLNPLPFPPLAWSPHGNRVIYAAASQDRSTSGAWSFGAKSSAVLFSANLDRPLGERLGKADGQSPAWRKDGSIVALVRAAGGQLAVREVEPSGEARDPVELPIEAGSAFAARWDMDHGQALIAVRESLGLGTNHPAHWLVRFGAEVEP